MMTGTKGMLFGIASGARGMIVLMAGLHGSLRFGNCHDVANCRRLSHMGKQEVTLHNILRYDGKTLSGGV
jgi:hypothetical protein